MQIKTMILDDVLNIKNYQRQLAVSSKGSARVEMARIMLAKSIDKLYQDLETLQSIIDNETDSLKKSELVEFYQHYISL